jgi:cytochrome P450
VAALPDWDAPRFITEADSTLPPQELFPNHACFSPCIGIVSPYIYLAARTGIVTAEGERWHGLRKQIAPTLKLEILEGVGMAAVRVTQRLFEDLDKACETGERVDMSEHFRRITLQVRHDLMVVGLDMFH